MQIQGSSFLCYINNVVLILKKESMIKPTHIVNKQNKYTDLRFDLSQIDMQGNQLDRQYIQIRETICNTRLYRVANRHMRIRLDMWSHKLDELVNDLDWKKNRNIYIKLMYLMAKAEIIVEPFLNLPPQGAISFLQKYEVNCIIDLVQFKIKEKNCKEGRCLQCLSEGKYTDNNSQNRKNMTNNSNWKASRGPQRFHSIRPFTTRQDEGKEEYSTRISFPSVSSSGKRKQGSPTMKREQKQIKLIAHWRNRKQRKDVESQKDDTDECIQIGEVNSGVRYFDRKQVR